MAYRTLPTHAQLVGAPIAGAVPLRRPTSRLARLGGGLLAVAEALWEAYLILATADRRSCEEREECDLGLHVSDDITYRENFFLEHGHYPDEIRYKNVFESES